MRNATISTNPGYLFAAGLLLTLSPAAVSAQAEPESKQPAPSEAPLPALPDLNIAERDLGDDRKYIVFHKEGVSVEQAREDMAFCWRFLPRGVQRKAGSFVPWRNADAARQVTYDGGNYGLVGAAIGAIISGPIERSIRQSRLYQCMLPKGYVRYRTSEDVWNLLNNDEKPQQSIDLQARIASGPVPPTQRMQP